MITWVTPFCLWTHLPNTRHSICITQYFKSLALEQNPALIPTFAFNFTFSMETVHMCTGQPQRVFKKTPIRCWAPFRCDFHCHTLCSARCQSNWRGLKSRCQTWTAHMWTGSKIAAKLKRELHTICLLLLKSSLPLSEKALALFSQTFLSRHAPFGYKEICQILYNTPCVWRDRICSLLWLDHSRKDFHCRTLLDGAYLLVTFLSARSVSELVALSLPIPPDQSKFPGHFSTTGFCFFPFQSFTRCGCSIFWECSFLPHSCPSFLFIAWRCPLVYEYSVCVLHCTIQIRGMLTRKFHILEDRRQVILPSILWSTLFCLLQNWGPTGLDIVIGEASRKLVR